MGGNGDGSGWDPSSNFNETIEYFQSQSFSFSQDESGNLFFTSGGTYSGPAIQLDQVVVNGVVYKPEDDSGSDNPFASGIAAMLERFLEDRDGSETEYDGSDGSDGSVDTYEGPVGGTNPGGGTSNGDPWLRDSNGSIITTKTQEPTFNYDDYNINMTMEEYSISTKNDEQIKIYKVTSVIDPNTGLPRPATAAESGNCLGYALTGLTGYWILDNPNTLDDPTTSAIENDEGKITREFITNTLGYSVTTNVSEAKLVMVYYGDEAIHAGIVRPNGTYDAKGGINPLVTGMTSEAQFLQPYGPNGPNYGQGTTVVYYK